MTTKRGFQGLARATLGAALASALAAPAGATTWFDHAVSAPDWHMDNYILVSAGLATDAAASDPSAPTKPPGVTTFIADIPSLTALVPAGGSLAVSGGLPGYTTTLVNPHPTKVQGYDLDSSSSFTYGDPSGADELEMAWTFFGSTEDLSVVLDDGIDTYVFDASLSYQSFTQFDARPFDSTQALGVTLGTLAIGGAASLNPSGFGTTRLVIDDLNAGTTLFDSDTDGAFTGLNLTLINGQRVYLNFGYSWELPHDIDPTLSFSLRGQFLPTGFDPGDPNAPVPEPGTVAMCLVGGLAALRRARRGRPRAL